jgi:uncharacterized protein (TIGR01777 family)
MNKVILAGGSGYIGNLLANFYQDRAKEVIVLTRGNPMIKGTIRYLNWNGKDIGPWAEELNGADLLVNLTGKNVNCRYNQKNKEEILNSRLHATTALGKAIERLWQPPRVWIQSASATIYRHAEDRPMDDLTGEIGTGFSVDVCNAWEKSFWQQSTPSTRKILLRIGIVLGKSDSALPRLLRLTQFGLGGKQGNGKQYMSWIHEADVVAAIDWCYNTEAVTGTFNCTAPQPLPNGDFMKTLRNVCKVPIGIPVPAWLLVIGAWLIGTETELILKSRWVVPTKLMAAGYKFQFPELSSALHDLLRLK